jgi:hypothetical protein
MSVSLSSTPLSSHHRRKLAAVVLRGDLTAYETTPAFKATIDRLIDELLESYGPWQETDSWDSVTDRIVKCFAHRLSKEGEHLQQGAAEWKVTLVTANRQPRRTFDGMGTVFKKRVMSKSYL